MNSSRQKNHENVLDIPISESGSDRLGFTEIASTYVEIITSQPNSASIILGLDGSWGSGKSSLLELLKNTLNEKTAKKRDDQIGTITVPFSPWLVTTRVELLKEYFDQLENGIDRASVSIKSNRFINATQRKALKSASEYIRKYRRHVIPILTTAAAADPTMLSGLSAAGVATLSKLVELSGDRAVPLEEIKDGLKKKLGDIAKEDSSFRILVVIDDLDRLDPEEAVEVLRLVKAVGDFPSITYLLAYDRKALARAVSKGKRGVDGDAYLEKIVQFSFKVPPPEPFRLRNWLKSEISDRYPHDANYQSEHANAVFDIWAGRLLHTPRDVKRLLFSIQVIWPKLRSKVDLLDLVWLEMVKEKASRPDADLYSWTTAYLQSLDAVAIGGRFAGAKESNDELTKILKNLGWRERTSSDDLSGIDPHDLDKLLAGITRSQLHEEETTDWTHNAESHELQSWRERKRLSSPWHWRFFFALDAPSHAITDVEWAALAQAGERLVDSLFSAISKLLEIRRETRTDAGDQIVDRIIYQQENGILQNPDRWLLVIIRHFQELQSVSKPGGIFAGFNRRIDRQIKPLVRSIIMNLDEVSRNDILRKIFGDSRNMEIAAELFRDQFHESKKPQPDGLFLSEKELSDICASQLEIYRALTPNTFVHCSDPWTILFAWYDATNCKEEPSQFLNATFESDEGLIKTLEALKRVTSSAQNGVPHIPDSDLDIFVDTKELKARLQHIASSKTSAAQDAKGLLEVWWSTE